MGNLKTYYESEKKNITSLLDIDSYSIDLSKVDKSPTNESSISFILEAFGKKFLFLGDAIIENKGKCPIIKKMEDIYGEKCEFEVIKLPHHGSAYNVSEDFFEKFKAKEYFISTNGKHEGHPSLDVLIKIISTSVDSKLILTNYPLKELDKINKTEFKRKYNYDLLIGNGTEIIEREYK